MTGYCLTWYLNGTPVSHTLRDLTSDALLEAAADMDLPCDWFTDMFVYRTLYAICYQLLSDDEAEVELGECGTVVVERV
ncbi:hypothetical protein [Mycolicibacterium fallax]|uniref:Uncharacterized protein n=1 Tax=Mycolicibacterium fallax TaxID=1793 RepID=A0A1X1RN57_MYCFA|nr:hypothetical protein [Mycolicibacterium fallax]ORV10044.1 hypothetical protein AWC04_01050 [Mycolicibacterium fallax]BBY98352.1 hypothetical protein MFAL_18190 [Mycolicibacterium fallax]